MSGKRKSKNPTAKHASYAFRLGRGEHSPDQEPLTEDSASAAAEREAERRAPGDESSIAPCVSEKLNSNASGPSLGESALSLLVTATSEREATSVATTTNEPFPQPEQDTTPPARFTTSIQDLRSDMHAVKSTLVRLLNSDLRSKNARIVYRIRVNPGARTIPLHRYVSTNVALGCGVLRVSSLATADVATLCAVGEPFPAPPFPKTYADTETMAREDIHALSVVMDDDFGIQEEDDVLICRTKMRSSLFW